MSLRDLQLWLWTHRAFRDAYEAVVRLGISRQFPSVATDLFADTPADWQHLLLAASALAASSDPMHTDAALRIAQECLCTASASDAERDAAALILDSLANRRALTLAESRTRLRQGLEHRLPPTARILWARRSVLNSVVPSNGRPISVNRFQLALWDSLNENTWTVATAPTSAGKSFIVSEWLAEKFREGSVKVAVYVAPTRALVSEIEAEFRRYRETGNLPADSISSLPHPTAPSASRQLFVLTQERLAYLLLDSGSPPLIDLLVVDEAQKVGDRHRGVLLQQVVDEAVARNSSMRVVFLCPPALNPDTLLIDAPAESRRTVVSSSVPTVNQSVVWLTQGRRRNEPWRLDTWLDGVRLPVGQVTIPNSPTTGLKRLTACAFHLGKEVPGNLVYVDSAAEAERAAMQLYSLLGDEAETPEEHPVRDLALLAKRTVDRRYSLAAVLPRAVAFHYGNMPTLLRNGIERLFRDGYLRYLICTSTLIEGVNLPCRTLFVRGPKKGKDESSRRWRPMLPADFWNLAGRAGRWGKDFQGNIVCVDADNTKVWSGEAPRSRVSGTIERASTRVLAAADGFVQYLGDDTPAGQKSHVADFDYVISYIAVNRQRLQSGGRKPAGLEPFLSRPDVWTASCEYLDRWSLPPELIARNPGITPAGMHRLLLHFGTKAADLDSLMPVHPSNADAASRYISILTRINERVRSVFGPEKRLLAITFLALDWMNGRPLPLLIANREARNKKQPRPHSIARVIRSTLEDIETVVRFQLPRYLRCYTDVLGLQLQRLGRADALPQFDFATMLECGVSTTTQISLLGIGLTRSSATLISEFAPHDDLSEAEVVEWLRSLPVDQLDVPSLVRDDVQSALGSQQGR